MPDQPFGLDHFELPCIFIPDGHHSSRAAFVGFDRVEFRAIWIPDDYQGPRPGYPWVEVGRMTLPSEQAAREERPRRMALAGADGPAASAAAAPVAAGVGGCANRTRLSEAGDSGCSGQRDRSVIAPFGPRRLPNTLPDLRATLAALEAVSVSNPVLISLARGDRTTLADAAAASPRQTSSQNGSSNRRRILDHQEPASLPSTTGGQMLEARLVAARVPMR